MKDSREGDRQLLLAKLEYVYSLMEVLGLGAIKLSIVFFYRRIFRGRAFNIASWIIIGIIIAWVITFLVEDIASNKSHLAARFNSLTQQKEKSVINMSAVLITLAASDILVDFAILILPIPLVSCHTLTLIGLLSY